MIVTSTSFLLSPITITLENPQNTFSQNDPYELHVVFDVTQYARFVATNESNDFTNLYHVDFTDKKEFF